MVIGTFGEVANEKMKMKRGKEASVLGADEKKVFYYEQITNGSAPSTSVYPLVIQVFTSWWLKDKSLQPFEISPGKEKLGWLEGLSVYHEFDRYENNRVKLS